MSPRTVFDEAREALEKAEAKHAPMRGPHEGYAVIEEEFLELRAEVFRQVIDQSALRKEALHLAAMAMRFVKDVCDSTDSFEAACRALLDAPHYDHFASRLGDDELVAIDRIKALVERLR